jgi:hypothetical protein
MATGLSPINRALNLVPKRAESRQTERLRETFVDSGVAAALEAVDHQVLYGRRGTGKTHALRYVETVVTSQGDFAVYADLRTIGSPEGLFVADVVPPTERAARLLVDLLSEIHDVLLTAALEDEALIVDETFIAKLDDLADSVSTVRVAGEVERSVEDESKAGMTEEAAVDLSLGAKPSLDIHAGGGTSTDARELTKETRRGTEQISLNFADVARALRALSDALPGKRAWLLLDEWSSVPADTQPFLAEFVVRCVLPLQKFTVKIAAIEQQTRFREVLPSGDVIGIEVGADVAANVDLDEFMVFEQNEDRARAFFLDLLFKHLTLGVEDHERVDGLAKENDLIRLGFTDKRAFDELVRAAEGVPRDAINIAAKAALRAQSNAISVPDIRAAARSWFQNDKEAALRSREQAQRLLNWIIDKVIKEKRARGFLVSQQASGAPLLLTLFDARVLHLVRRGYSAQDEPGERYDVYVIDYGAYVDLIHTKNEPQGVLPAGDDVKDGGYVDVPTQDLRAIRRAILNLDEFIEEEESGLFTAPT